MMALIRRRLAMVDRVMDFIEAYPSTDTSHGSLAAKLKEKLAQTDALAVQERDGRLEESAAQTRRNELRRIAAKQARVLVRAAEAGVKSHPELAKSFRVTPGRAPLKVFITEARAMLAAATAQKELLLSLGVGDTLIEEFAATLAEFDAETASVHNGKRNHVGARADLETACQECVQLVDQLDAINQLRFRDNAELLAAWNSAKNVAGPFRGSGSGGIGDVPMDEGAPPEPATPAEPPPALPVDAGAAKPTEGGSQAAA